MLRDFPRFMSLNTATISLAETLTNGPIGESLADAASPIAPSGDFTSKRFLNKFEMAAGSLTPSTLAERLDLPLSCHSSLHHVVLYGTTHRAPDGRPYYYNAAKQESVWEKPKPMKELEGERLGEAQAHEGARRYRSHSSLHHVVLYGTTHRAPDGRPYYYNAAKQESVWEKPKPMKELEGERLGEAQAHEGARRYRSHSSLHHVVLYGTTHRAPDGRPYYYNAAKQESVWEKPKPMKELEGERLGEAQAHEGARRYRSHSSLHHVVLYGTTHRAPDGRPYYYNAAKQESVWEKPKPMKELEGERLGEAQAHEGARRYRSHSSLHHVVLYGTTHRAPDGRPYYYNAAKQESVWEKPKPMKELEGERLGEAQAHEGARRYRSHSSLHHVVLYGTTHRAPDGRPYYYNAAKQESVWEKPKPMKELEGERLGEAQAHEGARRYRSHSSLHHVVLYGTTHRAPDGRPYYYNAAKQESVWEKPKPMKELEGERLGEAQAHEGARRYRSHSSLHHVVLYGTTHRAPDGRPYYYNAAKQESVWEKPKPMKELEGERLGEAQAHEGARRYRSHSSLHHVVLYGTTHRAPDGRPYYYNAAKQESVWEKPKPMKELEGERLGEAQAHEGARRYRSHSSLHHVVLYGTTHRAPDGRPYYYNAAKQESVWEKPKPMKELEGERLGEAQAHEGARRYRSHSSLHHVVLYGTTHRAPDGRPYYYNAAKQESVWEKPKPMKELEGERLGEAQAHEGARRYRSHSSLHHVVLYGTTHRAPDGRPYYYNAAKQESVWEKPKPMKELEGERLGEAQAHEGARRYRSHSSLHHVVLYGTTHRAPDGRPYYYNAAKQESVWEKPKPMKELEGERLGEAQAHEGARRYRSHSSLHHVVLYGTTHRAPDGRPYYYNAAKQESVWEKPKPMKELEGERLGEAQAHEGARRYRSHSSLHHVVLYGTTHRAPDGRPYYYNAAKQESVWEKPKPMKELEGERLGEAQAHEGARRYRSHSSLHHVVLYGTTHRAPDGRPYYYNAAKQESVWEKPKPMKELEGERLGEAQAHEGARRYRSHSSLHHVVLYGTTHRAPDGRPYYYNAAKQESVWEKPKPMKELEGERLGEAQAHEGARRYRSHSSLHHVVLYGTTHRAPDGRPYYYNAAKQESVWEKPKPMKELEGERLGEAQAHEGARRYRSHSSLHHVVLYGTTHRAPDGRPYYYNAAKQESVWEKPKPMKELEGERLGEAQAHEGARRYRSHSSLHHVVLYGTTHRAPDGRPYYYNAAKQESVWEKPKPMKELEGERLGEAQAHEGARRYRSHSSLHHVVLYGTTHRAPDGRPYYYNAAKQESVWEKPKPMKELEGERLGEAQAHEGARRYRSHSSLHHVVLYGTTHRAPDGRPYYYNAAKQESVWEKPKPMKELEGERLGEAQAHEGARRYRSHSSLHHVVLYGTTHRAPDGRPYYYNAAKQESVWEKPKPMKELEGERLGEAQAHEGARRYRSHSSLHHVVLYGTTHRAPDGRPYYYNAAKQESVWEKPKPMKELEGERLGEAQAHEGARRYRSHSSLHHVVLYGTTHRAPDGRPYYYNAAKQESVWEKPKPMKELEGERLGEAQAHEGARRYRSHSSLHHVVLYGTTHRAPDGRPYYYNAAKQESVWEKPKPMKELEGERLGEAQAHEGARRYRSHSSLHHVVLYGTTHRAPDGRPYYYNAAKQESVWEKPKPMKELEGERLGEAQAHEGARRYRSHSSLHHVVLYGTTHRAPDGRPYYYNAAKQESVWEKPKPMKELEGERLGEAQAHEGARRYRSHSSLHHVVLYGTTHRAPDGRPYYYNAAKQESVWEKPKPMKELEGERLGEAQAHEGARRYRSHSSLHHVVLYGTTHRAPDGRPYYYNAAKQESVWEKPKPMKELEGERLGEAQAHEGARRYRSHSSLHHVVLYGTTHRAPDGRPYYYNAAKQESVWEKPKPMKELEGERLGEAQAHEGARRYRSHSSLHHVVLYGTTHRAPDGRPYYYNAAKQESVWEKPKPMKELEGERLGEAQAHEGARRYRSHSSLHHVVLYGTTHRAPDGRPYYYNAAKQESVWEKPKPMKELEGERLGEAQAHEGARRYRSHSSLHHVVLYGTTHRAPDGRPYYYNAAKQESVWEKPKPMKELEGERLGEAQAHEGARRYRSHSSLHHVVLYGTTHRAPDGPPLLLQRRQAGERLGEAQAHEGARRYRSHSSLHHVVLYGTTHRAPDGRPYYYNAAKQESVWEKPKPMKELEGERLGEAQAHEGARRYRSHSSLHHVVLYGTTHRAPDGRPYYYNAAKQESVWEKPKPMKELEVLYGTTHRAPDGRPYYYNAAKQESVWEKPKPMKELEGERLGEAQAHEGARRYRSHSSLHHVVLYGTTHRAPRRPPLLLQRRQAGERLGEAQAHEGARRYRSHSSLHHVVLYGTTHRAPDGRPYYYNAAKQESVWEKPKPMKELEGERLGEAQAHEGARRYRSHSSLHHVVLYGTTHRAPDGRPYYYNAAKQESVWEKPKPMKELEGERLGEAQAHEGARRYRSHSSLHHVVLYGTTHRAPDGRPYYYNAAKQESVWEKPKPMKELEGERLGEAQAHEGARRYRSHSSLHHVVLYGTTHRAPDGRPYYYNAAKQESVWEKPKPMKELEGERLGEAQAHEGARRYRSHSSLHHVVLYGTTHRAPDGRPYYYNAAKQESVWEKPKPMKELEGERLGEAQAHEGARRYRSHSSLHHVVLYGTTHRAPDGRPYYYNAAKQESVWEKPKPMKELEGERLGEAQAHEGARRYRSHSSLHHVVLYGTTHRAPDGRPYYYNAAKQESVWEKPKPMKELEGERLGEAQAHEGARRYRSHSSLHHVVLYGTTHRAPRRPRPLLQRRQAGERLGEAQAHEGARRYRSHSSLHHVVLYGTTHRAPDGRPYYYNAAKQESVWEKPKPMKELEGERLGEAQAHEGARRYRSHSSLHHVVLYGTTHRAPDGRPYYYNAAKQESVWEKPKPMKELEGERLGEAQAHEGARRYRSHSSLHHVVLYGTTHRAPRRPPLLLQRRQAGERLGEAQAHEGARRYRSHSSLHHVVLYGTTHRAPDGRPYYYNAAKQESVLGEAQAHEGARRYRSHSSLHHVVLYGTTHRAPDGRPYYYNAAKQESVWEKPKPMKELEGTAATPLSIM
ncbi:hypothetical protein PYW07_013477 [Mythimna separata]|uniref:WW domain-containing protein n=1 Tax=Mythimna separata TaxID=271217 RepID=A0AAD8DK11_MYTSE|nr:hypothetical protein PYW07_013477 [Mythimna separata]